MMICSKCKKPKVEDRWKMCAVCREYQRAANKRRRTKQKAAGLCQRCDKRAEDGHIYCGAHLQYMREHTRKWMGPKHCKDCGTEIPRGDGKILCPDCWSRCLHCGRTFGAGPGEARRKRKRPGSGGGDARMHGL